MTAFASDKERNGRLTDFMTAFASDIHAFDCVTATTNNAVTSTMHEYKMRTRSTAMHFKNSFLWPPLPS